MTGNQLKILALVAMTIDHIGVILLPQYFWLRIVGRLAFPIFAYMIAEGCFYTRDKKRYLGLVCALGVVCQVVYWFAGQSLEQSILTTFALSILLVYALQLMERTRAWWAAVLFAFVAVADAALCLLGPGVLGHGFRVDYGFVGTMLPVLCYMPRLGMTRQQAKEEDEQQARRRRLKMLAWTAVGLVALALSINGWMGGVQWWGLFALVPLALYNGKRGTWPLKYLFYIYYPLHLAVLYVISQLL